MSALRPGQDRLGSYTVERELGGGAMGTVYLAQGESGAVALKVIHPHLMTRATSLDRFRREAQAGARVDHPNVVRTLAADTALTPDGSCCYLVMEFVEGRTLRALLDEWEVVPEALVREVARQAAAGLAAIHEAGVVHRDLKPENLLITDDHRVRIMDLGVALFADASDAPEIGSEFAGTLSYAAPEVFRGEPVTFAADLYSLGVLLYELVTGSNPFRFEETPAMVRAHLDLVPPSAGAGDAEVSPFLCEVVATLLGKDADARFASATLLLDTLEQGEDSAWWGTRRQEVRERGPKLPRVPVRRETRLYGRGSELALLRQCWERAREGEGNVILLEGEAGIGKSRLVDAFLHQLDDAETHVLYGSYSPAGGRGGISDALVAFFGEDGLEAGIASVVGAMAPLASSLAAAVMRHAPMEGAAPVDGRALATACAEGLKSLAAEKPVLWVVEDLHFASPDARQRVLGLARAVAGRRILLVLTTRPGLPEGELLPLRQLEAYQGSGLRRLGAREVILLLQDAFRSESLADQLGARVALKSDGIPFFVFEMIRELKENGLVQRAADGSWFETRVIDRIEVPSAVRDLIDVRVGVLSKEERSILDVGAVDGYLFDPRRVADVLRRRPVAVLQDLAHIERRSGVIRAQGHACRFDHHQIQEVLYEDLPLALREEYHAALGDAIVAGLGPDAPLAGEPLAEACRHYLAGRRGADAGPLIHEALAFLAAVHAPAESAALARAALGEPGVLEGAERMRVLLSQAETLHLLGHREEERSALDEAVALSSDVGASRLRAHALAGLGRWFERAAAYPEATRALEEAVAIAAEAGDVEREMLATRVLGVVAYAVGDFETCRRRHTRQCALAERHGNPIEMANARGGLGTALARLGRFDEALACFRYHLDTAQQEGERLPESVAHGNLGVTLTDLGRNEEAVEHFEQQLAISRELGNREGECRAVGYVAYIDVMLGRLPEAMARYERARTIAEEIGDRRAESMASGNIGTCLLRLGRLDEARERFEHWLEVARETGNKAAEGGALGNLGYIALRQSRHEESRALYLAWLDIARESGDRSAQVQARSFLSSLLLHEGRWDEAYEHAAQQLRICEESGDRRGEAQAAGRLGRVALATGHPGKAAALQARRLDIARSVPDREEECTALEAVATLAELQGRSVEALRCWDDALRLARELGGAERESRLVAERALLLRESEGGHGALQSLETSCKHARDVGTPATEAWALYWRARVLVEEGRLEEARQTYVRAEEAARPLLSPEIAVLAACWAAVLPDAPVEPALEAFGRHGEVLPVAARMECLHLLWRATGDVTHLAESRCLLDGLLLETPEENREAMAQRVELHRAILADETDARRPSGGAEEG